jgi:ABC-2 type transport system ATP-binding protein
MTAIACEELSKIYRSGIFRRREVRALQDFTLSVERGQIFSLLGPNGAGKTTFIKVLLSLTHATAGRASLLDTPLPHVRVRTRVGYLPENHRYPGYLTGDQVLTSFGALSGVPRAMIASRIETLLDLVGMKEWRAVKVKKYSKGMLQRLGLAQALVNDPDLLFLDEPTDGVDPVGRKEIRDVLKNLKSQGKTIFLNSHLLSEVELISDRVAILDKGRLLKVGTVDELTAAGEEYRIDVAGTIPEPFIVEARALVMKVRVEGDRLIMEVTEPAALNRLIDLLRKHGVMITTITQHRSSLEESFITLIKREVNS